MIFRAIVLILLANRAHGQQFSPVSDQPLFHLEFPDLPRQFTVLQIPLSADELGIATVAEYLNHNQSTANADFLALQLSKASKVLFSEAPSGLIVSIYSPKAHIKAVLAACKTYFSAISKITPGLDQRRITESLKLRAWENLDIKSKLRAIAVEKLFKRSPYFRLADIDRFRKRSPLKELLSRLVDTHFVSAVSLGPLSAAAISNAFKPWRKEQPGGKKKTFTESVPTSHKQHKVYLLPSASRQAQILAVFPLTEHNNPSEFLAMRIAIAALGKGPSSTLNQVLRAKNLAYSASAALDHEYPFWYIDTAFSSENLSQVLKIIRSQQKSFKPDPAQIQNAFRQIELNAFQRRSFAPNLAVRALRDFLRFGTVNQQFEELTRPTNDLVTGTTKAFINDVEATLVVTGNALVLADAVKKAGYDEKNIVTLSFNR